MRHGELALGSQTGRATCTGMWLRPAASGTTTMAVTRYLATLGDGQPRFGPLSHRGGQGFKSPQLHESFPGQSYLHSPAVDGPRGDVRLWEPNWEPIRSRSWSRAPGGHPRRGSRTARSSAAITSPAHGASPSERCCGLGPPSCVRRRAPRRARPAWADSTRRPLRPRWRCGA